VPFVTCNSQAGEAAPASLDGCAALAILGGEMSANDALPGLRQAEQLFLQALRDGVPTLGHCLGGQLMARALGARVGPSPAPEIGWQPLQREAGAEAEAWFGPQREQTVFEWHYEAFDLPAGAQRLASSAACPNQAFALGPHLAMQFHVELDEDKLGRWAAETSTRWQAAARRHGSVQDAAAMLEAGARRLQAQQRLADRIYGRWLALAAAR
jgi:GMP synthase-like glutamine amidotransferase